MSPKLSVPLPNDGSLLDYFQLFFNAHIHVVECTNAYATTRLEQMPPSWKLLFRYWKRVTFSEIKVFVGVKLNMVLVQLSQLKDYWLTHDILNIQFFHSV